MIVYTGGTFDLFHAGHAKFLERAATFGAVVVALNTDEFIKEFKGSAPIMTYAERETVLNSCLHVTEVTPNTHGQDSKPTILRVDPDILIVGMDWMRGDDYLHQMQIDRDWLTAEGIGLCYIPYTQGISTTELKRRFQKLL